jgi:hypothetical protein
LLALDAVGLALLMVAISTIGGGDGDTDNNRGPNHGEANI